MRPTRRLVSRILRFSALIGLLIFANCSGNGQTAVDAWLGAQTNIQSWSADFVQIRTLKALTQPLMATGHVWFAAPNQFRWELGNPAQTIAVKQAEEMMVIYPFLKRAERYPLGRGQTGPWRDALDLLQAGFPRSRSDLESKFRISSQTASNNLVALSLEPKSAGARRMMPQLKVVFATNDLSLRATELQFADGSTLRNDFRNAELNPRIDPARFNTELGSEYKIVEPLKSR